MSELKLCQGNKCHQYNTKDRIRGSQGNKHYETRRRSSFYYGDSNFCSLNCQNDWFYEYGNKAIDHFRRITEAKKVECDSAWYKERDWRNGGFYYVNDLLGKKIPITNEQYSDENYTINTSGQ